MTNVLRAAVQALERGEAVALASIAGRRGSAPRGAGTRFLVFADGSSAGTIGGGLLEAETLRVAAQCLADGRTRLLRMRMDARTVADQGMLCGGAVDVLVRRLDQVARAAVAEGAAWLEGSGGGFLVSTWGAGGEGGRVAALASGGPRGGTPTGALDAGLERALAAAEAGASPVLHGDEEGGVLVEPLTRERPRLVILGGGHVGRALAGVAVQAGFAVEVVDDRPEFAQANAFPDGVRVVCRPFAGALEAVGADAESLVVVCTRGHLADAVCAEEALRGPAPYVGVIGSRRKRSAFLKHFRELGIADQRVAALRMPVGLDIGAETPGEIAVAVVGELVAFHRRQPEGPQGA